MRKASPIYHPIAEELRLIRAEIERMNEMTDQSRRFALALIRNGNLTTEQIIAAAMEVSTTPPMIPGALEAGR